jgi:hypothetical protein
LHIRTEKLRLFFRQSLPTLAMAVALLTAIAVPLLDYLPPTDTAYQPLSDAAKGLDDYTFDLKLNPQDSTLSVSMSLKLTNRTPDTWQDVVIRTYPGAYHSRETSPAASEELFDLCYPYGFSPGRLLLHDVTWNSIPIPVSFDDAAMTVLRADTGDIAPGTSGTLALRMVLFVPECLSRFGRTNDVWLFGNSLPILSVYEDGAWRTDPYLPVGDPFVSECANYSVTIALSEGFQLLAGAPVQKTRGRFTCKALAVRDFSFAVAQNLDVATTQVEHTQIRAYAHNSQTARQALRFAKDALSFYNDIYGLYPYPVYTVFMTPIPFAGVEYACFVLINRDYAAPGLEDMLELVIAHETAHQWFYALVGSDQYRHPWQDEAVSEHAMMSYVRHVHGLAAYDSLVAHRIDAPMRENIRPGITPGSPLDLFANIAEYTSVVYGRGAAALQAVDLMTNGKVDSFLKEYVHRFSFRLATRQDFETLLNDFMQEDLSPLLRDYLDTVLL